MVSILDFSGHMVPVVILNSPTLAPKEPRTKHHQVSVAGAGDLLMGPVDSSLPPSSLIRITDWLRQVFVLLSPPVSSDSSVMYVSIYMFLGSLFFVLFCFIVFVVCPSSTYHFLLTSFIIRVSYLARQNPSLILL